jgi:hypothetical protein
MWGKRKGTCKVLRPGISAVPPHLYHQNRARGKHKASAAVLSTEKGLLPDAVAILFAGLAPPKHHNRDPRRSSLPRQSLSNELGVLSSIYIFSQNRDFFLC